MWSTRKRVRCFQNVVQVLLSREELDNYDMSQENADAIIDIGM